MNAPYIYHYTVATLQTIMLGVGFGWVPPTISSFNNADGEFSLTDEDCSWIASLHYLGRLIGSVLAAATMDRIGRVAIIVMVSVMEVLVWIGVAVMRVVLVHYAIRLVFGIAMGLLDTVLPVYVGENSAPNLRGVFGITISLFFFGGQIAAYAMATYMPYLLVAAVAAGLALINLCLVWLLREPAQYLLMRGRVKKAKTRFQWLRGHGERLDREFDEMTAKLSSVEAEFSLRMLLDPRVRIVCWTHVLIFFTGFPPINAFSTFILEPTSTFSRDELTILLGVAQFAGAAFATVFIEKFGRRTLWTVGCLLCIAAHSANAVLHYCLANDTPIPGLPWLLFAALAAYGATYASVIHALINTARGELLPAKFKAAGVCTAIVLNSAVGFGTTQIFMITAATFGVASTFVFFSLGSLVLLIYVHFCVPETKGLTLMEIQKLFEGERGNESNK